MIKKNANSTDEILTARKGTFLVNNTTEKTVDHYMIVVLEDTVFASIKVGGVDVKSTYIADPTVAVKAGAILTPLDINFPFSGVDLTSGSVTLVLR